MNKNISWSDMAQLFMSTQSLNTWRKILSKYKVITNDGRGLTTCHTQYTWDSSICIFLFNRTTLQVFVTYLTGALYVHPLWFYKHQHDNPVRSKLFVACQRWWFQWRFAAILVNCAPSGEMHNYCTPHIIKENYENFLIHRCNYILLSEVYCVWQVVKTATVIFNNPVLTYAILWKWWWFLTEPRAVDGVSLC